MSDVDPIVGQWYHNIETDTDFEVVRLDEDAQIIEIQTVDGDIDEIDWDAWYEQPIEPTDPPDGWDSGARDDLVANFGDEEEEETSHLDDEEPLPEDEDFDEEEEE